MSSFAVRALLIVSILLVVADPGMATCTNPTIIQNLRLVSYTTTGAVLAWDPPSGFGAGTQYDVMGESASNYCSLGQQYHLDLLDSVSSTTATITGLAPDSAYGFSVRIKNDYCSWSANELTFDTYTTPPAKPVITKALAGQNGVSVQFSYSDTRVPSIAVERAPAGGAYSNVYLIDACSTNPKTFNWCTGPTTHSSEPTSPS